MKREEYLEKLQLTLEESDFGPVEEAISYFNEILEDLIQEEGMDEEAAIATPALTTVWNGQREVGRQAAKALVDRLSGIEVHGDQDLITPELHIRQSTSALRET